MPWDGTINLQRPQASVLKYEVELNPVKTAQEEWDQWCIDYGFDSLSGDYALGTIYGTSAGGAGSTGGAAIITTQVNPLSRSGGEGFLMVSGKGQIGFAGVSPGVSELERIPDPAIGIYQPTVRMPLIVNYGALDSANWVYNTAPLFVRRNANVTLLLIEMESSLIIALKITNNSIEISTPYFANSYSAKTRSSVAVFDSSASSAFSETVFTGSSTGGVPATKAKVTMFFDQYSVSGTIDENLDLNKFNVAAHDYKTKVKVKTAEVDTSVDSDFQIFFAPANTVQVTVTPKADMWEANKVLIAGDVIFPTDPITTPYYFIVSVAGTTGAVEPTWISVAGNVADNTVTFTWADRIVAPVTNAPVIPQIV